MTQRHIAVIAAGIDEEYQNSVLDGIIAFAHEKDINVSCFAAFGGVIGSRKFDIGEYNIYSLVNYARFDGAILLTNTVNDPGVKKRILTDVKAAGIPGVLLDGNDDEAFYNIKIDNAAAMRDVIQHVVTVHGAKTLNFVSGPLANPEAQTRYEAFLQVMAENKLIADARRIYFGEFRFGDGRAAVKEMLASGLPMPDAVICANDAMALGVIDGLEKAGYTVPDDVIVTGFDATYNARHGSPELTTVERPLFEAGYQACSILLDAAEGRANERVLHLGARAVMAESCGCQSPWAEDIRAYKKSVYRLVNDTRADIGLLNSVTSELAETESAKECVDVLSRFMDRTGVEQWALCLCSEWDTAFNGPRGQVDGYTKTMSAPLVMTKDEVTSVDSFLSGQMFPQSLQGGGHVSFFLPLHFRERALGYCIFTDGDFPTKSLLCHSLMMNISNSIENIRKLLHLSNVISELDKLYVVDPLCGIYNRNGFIREADILYHRCEDQKEPLLISFIDMDGLKLINDNFGHKEGDFALQRLAAVIRDCCTTGQICARFGGDEFIILGIGSTEDEAEMLEHNFYKRLEEINRIIHKPYQLDASIGTYVAKVQPGVTLFNMITTADQMMYERKKRKKTSRYLRRD